MKTIDLEEKIYEIRAKTYKDIVDIISEFDNKINKIETNAILSLVLLDYLNQEAILGDGPNKPIPYIIGNINNVALYVNPCQLWSNQTIYLKKDDEIIETLEIIDKHDILT